MKPSDKNKWKKIFGYFWQIENEIEWKEYQSKKNT